MEALDPLSELEYQKCRMKRNGLLSAILRINECYLLNKQTTKVLNQLLNDFYVLKRQFIYRFFYLCFYYQLT